MKKIIILVLVLFQKDFLSAQIDGKIVVPFDTITEKYSYAKVLDIQGKSASELFTLAKTWCVEKNLDSKFLNEEVNERITDQGSFPINVILRAKGGIESPIVFTALYTIDIKVKDSKCKIVVTNIQLSQNANGMTDSQTLENYKTFQESTKGYQRDRRLKAVVDVFNEADRNIKSIMTDLENVLKGKATKTEW